MDARHRIEHILKSPDAATDQDFDRILLQIRESNGGIGSMTDIGNFLAHRGERDSGLLATSVRESFAASFDVSVDEQGLKRVTFDPTKKRFWKPIKGLSGRLTDDVAKSRFGLSRNQLLKRLALIIVRQMLRGFGTLTPDDLSILDGLSAMMRYPVYSNGKALFRDFSRSLLQLDLLKESEQKSFARIERRFLLHVFTLLHGCAVAIDGRRRPVLRVASDSSGMLVLVARFTVPGRPQPLGDLMVLESELPVRDVCAPVLQATLDDIEEPLEVRRGRIVPLSTPRT